MVYFSSLVQKYKTPLYVYDFDIISSQYKLLKKSFGSRKFLIFYAIKANPNLSIIKFIASMGGGADCVSIGEVNKALLAGINKSKIIFSGVGKLDKEIKEALEKDILMFNVESEEEFNQIEYISSKLGKVARISVRINPDIPVDTHKYITTGLHENKFGIDIITAKKIYIRAKKSDFINPVGIHFHLGSQIKDFSPINKACKKVIKLISQLLSYNIDIKLFNVGGGIGVNYSSQEHIKIENYREAILSAIKSKDFTIMCEPGRFLVANSGYLLTRVVYEKKTPYKRFIIVDAAMNDFMRPSLYNAYHKIEPYNKNLDKKDYSSFSKADIVGSICESSDFFAKDIPFPKVDKGDILIIKDAGAYCFSMSSNYNVRRRAAEVAVIDGKDRLIRRRENFSDLISCEKDYI